MRRKQVGAFVRGLGLVLLVGSSIASARSAHAQGFELLRFHPAGSQRVDYLSVESGQAMLPRNWETGLWMQWSDDPLVSNPEGRELPIIESQMVFHLINSISFLERVRLTIDVPLYVSQDGTNEVLLGQPAGSLDEVGLGDVRIIPKVSLLDQRNGDELPGFALALRLPLSLSLGESRAFQGESVRVEPGVAADYATPGGWGIGLNVGYLLREDQEIGVLEITDAVTYGVAGRVPIVPRHFFLVAEMFGALPVGADTFDAEEAPLEALGALRLTAGNFAVTAGAGTAITNGVGGPDARILGAVAYSPVARADRDHDGITDDVDGCPDEPEDSDGFADSDGCPDPDNDEDGLVDDADRCPNEPEDADGFRDDDGCPDPDNDGDGFLDAVDRCPNEPENRDGYQDDDGCPDERPIVEPEPEPEPDLPATPYLVPVAVHFEYDSDTITAQSERDLDRIAEVLASYPQTADVEVAGHADERGTAEYNRDLSQRRAEQVVDELVERGVDRRLIHVRAAGEAEPLDRDETEPAYQRNRRVEVRILEFR